MSRQPLVDLGATWRELREELLPVVEAVFAGGGFIGGAAVQEFERAFAEACGCHHAVGVANGTDALHLALRALGIGPGDEVITVANSFVATAEAIGHAGARAVLVDVRPDSLLMDAAQLDAALTPRTRAVIPVHLYGRLADVNAIGPWCRRTGVAMVEDAAQAHGAELEGRVAGSFGHVGTFSFYPAKNLGAAGDAGAIVMDDDGLAERVRRLRDHGQSRRYFHDVEGYNSRLDALQAAVLAVKLPRLAAWNERRRVLADLYRERLASVKDVELPGAPPDPRSHVYHLFVVRTQARDALRDALAAEGIETGLHYPVPIHLQPAYRHLGHGEGAFPVSEAAAREVLSLPIYPQMTDDAVGRVSDAVARFFGSR